MSGQDEPSFFEVHGIAEEERTESKKLFQEIQEIVHKHITKGGHDYTPDPLEYRASSIGVCSRKIFLEKEPKKYLKESDIIKLPIWYQNQMDPDREDLDFGPHISGQVIHEVIQEALGKRIISMEEEVTRQIGKATLKGHYDLLIEDDSGEQIVIDIKSTRTPRKYLPNKKHLRQLMAYQGMMGGIRGGLLYVDRNSFQMSFVSQEFSKEKFSRIVIKLTQMAEYEINGELPPPIPEFDEECITMYFKCPFYGFCFPEN